MKKINLLAVALAAFTMFSCSNEEIADLGSNAPGEKATLTIKVEGEGNNVAQSRAIGTTTTDVTINNYIVFLFREGGALDCPPFYSSSSAAATITNGSTAAKTAYVVANVGRLANSPFANVTTEAELKAVAGDLMASNNTASQTRTNLWMSGTSNVSFNGTIGTVTVPLSSLQPRLNLLLRTTVPISPVVVVLRLQTKRLYCCMQVKAENSLEQQPKRLLKPLSIRVMPLIRVLIQTLSQHLLPWQMR